MPSGVVLSGSGPSYLVEVFYTTAAADLAIADINRRVLVLARKIADTEPLLEAINTQINGLYAVLSAAIDTYTASAQDDAALAVLTSAETQYYADVAPLLVNRDKYQSQIDAYTAEKVSATAEKVRYLRESGIKSEVKTLSTETYSDGSAYGTPTISAETEVAIVAIDDDPINGYVISGGGVEYAAETHGLTGRAKALPPYSTLIAWMMEDHHFYHRPFFVSGTVASINYIDGTMSVNFGRDIGTKNCQVFYGTCGVRGFLVGDDVLGYFGGSRDAVPVVRGHKTNPRLCNWSEAFYYSRWYKAGVIYTQTGYPLSGYDLAGINVEDDPAPSWSIDDMKPDPNTIPHGISERHDVDILRSVSCYYDTGTDPPWPYPVTIIRQDFNINTDHRFMGKWDRSDGSVSYYRYTAVGTARWPDDVCGLAPDADACQVDIVYRLLRDSDGAILDTVTVSRLVSSPGVYIPPEPSKTSTIRLSAYYP